VFEKPSFIEGSSGFVALMFSDRSDRYARLFGALKTMENQTVLKYSIVPVESTNIADAESLYDFYKGKN